MSNTKKQTPGCRTPGFIDNGHSGNGMPGQPELTTDQQVRGSNPRGCTSSTPPAVQSQSNPAPVDDGGPAFPRPSGPGQENVDTTAQHGMSLRAWLAGQALTGMLANPAYSSSDYGYARDAVMYADAVIRELKGGKS